MSAPLISICIPVYNGERYLAECLRSALAQNYADFEIVIVDDLSTDGSFAIAESYARISDKIRLVKNEKNQGLTGNWNRCIEAARGEWIKFLFQDDLLHPSCLRKMIEIAGESSSLIVSKRNFLIEEGVPEILKNYYRKEVLTLEKIYSGRVPELIPAAVVSTLGVKYLGMNFIGEPTTVFFKKEVIKQLGNFEKELYQICDLEYWLRIGSIYGLITIPEAITTFRVHTSSATFNTISTKEYTSSFGDPGILSGKMLYDPVFGKLRSVLPFMERQRLKEYYYLKQYEGLLYKRDHPQVVTPQSLILEKMPGYEKIQKGRLLTRLIHRIILMRRNLQKKALYL